MQNEFSSHQPPALDSSLSPAGRNGSSDSLRSDEPKRFHTSQSLDDITASLKQCLTTDSREIITTGRLLIQAKALVGHGNFINWLVISFCMSSKTANRFMSVAQLVQRHRLDEDDIMKLLSLDLKSLYELAAKSTPTSVQSQALAELDSGRVTFEQIRDWKQRARKDKTPPDAGAENIRILTNQLEHFETWYHHTRPLLESASKNLDEASRMALQLHVRQLSSAITRLEALLSQAATFPDEPVPVQASQADESSLAYWPGSSSTSHEPYEDDGMNQRQQNG